MPSERTDDTPTAAVPSPQLAWQDHARRLPRDLARTAQVVAESGRFLATAIRDDRARGELHPRIWVALLRHDLGDRALEPWRWTACGLLPRAAVYRVVLHAIARTLGNDDAALVPAMEVVARWGRPRERAAAAQRHYRRSDGVGSAVLDDGSVTLAAGDAAWLNVLIDAAVPREPGGPMDWEGDGRAHGKAMLGYDEHGSVLGAAHPRNRPEEAR